MSLKVRKKVTKNGTRPGQKYSPQRRCFLKRVLLCGTFSLLPPPFFRPPKNIGKNRIKQIVQRNFGKVYIYRSTSLLRENGDINDALATSILQKAVMEITGGSNPRTGFGALFDKNDVVGIKVNCLAGRKLSPRPGLLRAIVRCLKAAGINEKRIIIWDRTTRELRKAGLNSRNCGGAVVAGTDVFGYEDEPEIVGDIGSCFSRILTRKITALINVPVLKDHDLAGISVALKNMFGAIHNPNKYHDNNCDPYVADVNMQKDIREKLRLVICDASVVVFDGGPSYVKEGSKIFGGLLISTDPVALDRAGMQIIESMRKEAGLLTLAEEGRYPRWINTATKLGLGEGRPEKVELIDLQNFS